MGASRPSVVLVGPPAAGKSRVGKRVARILGVPFLDTDSTIVAVHGPIVDIFEAHGEPHFRALERHAVIEALRQPGVVALGGGAVINADTRADLSQHRVVLVTISENAVADRLGTGKRPLVKDGLESWKKLVEPRWPWYHEVSDISFDTSVQSLDHIAEQIAQWIEREESA
jgi:shikimate kinase